MSDWLPLGVVITAGWFGVYMMWRHSRQGEAPERPHLPFSRDGDLLIVLIVVGFVLPLVVAAFGVGEIDDASGIAIQSDA